MSSCSAPSSVVPPQSNACNSFASLRARQVTDTHHLRIDGYSAANRLVLAGDSINSRTFSAGGHKWQLSYYPNGHKSYNPPGATTSSAFELTLKDGSSKHDDEVVMAAYRLSILDRDGNPAYSFAAGPQRFDKSSKYRHRVNDLATPEERQAAALRLVEDDSLTVLCDVSVTRFDKESRIKWYLRKLLLD